MIAVLDSGILMNIHYLPEIKESIYLTNSVLHEVKSNIAKNMLDLFLADKKITIMDPDPKYFDKIKQIEKKMGSKKLSTTDKEILALGLQLVELDNEVIIYTDDYGIRNIAHELNIKSQGIKTTGGDEKREYSYRCTACSNVYNFSIDECEVCGHNKLSKFRRK